MAKKTIYESDPKSLRYMGYRYVLAEDEGDDSSEDTSKKRGRPGAARVRMMERCRNNGVRFVVEALIEDKDGKRLPYGGRASSATNPELTIKEVTNLDQIPSSILDNIPKTSEGAAVRDRIDAILKKRRDGGKRLFMIRAKGGWTWTDDKQGTKGVEGIQSILKEIRKDRAANVYVYCANHLI